MQQVVRYLDAADLAARVARRLVAAIAARQADGHVVHICLTGGRTATSLYQNVGSAMAESKLDPERLELWWSDECFVPTANPARLAGSALAELVRYFALDPARTHPMPASDGSFDASAAAANYARELGDTCFDICLLGVGDDGHAASLFPGHPACEATGRVVAVQDPPLPPERLSLTIPALSSSAEVWFLASGTEKAKVVAAGVNQDQSIPAGRIQGTEATVWLVDRDAARELPYFECSL